MQIVSGTSSQLLIDEESREDNRCDAYAYDRLLSLLNECWLRRHFLDLRLGRTGCVCYELILGKHAVAPLL